MAGGTGIYTFSDLIDLLYKDYLVGVRPEVQEEVYKISPVLKGKPFEAWEFALLAAFNSLEDLHEITFSQLAELSANGIIDLTLKVKKDKEKHAEYFKKAEFTSDSFDVVFRRQLKVEKTSKVLISGPPKMSQGVSSFIKN